MSPHGMLLLQVRMICWLFWSYLALNIVTGIRGDFGRSSGVADNADLFVALVHDGRLGETGGQRRLLARVYVGADDGESQVLYERRQSSDSRVELVVAECL